MSLSSRGESLNAKHSARMEYPHHVICLGRVLRFAFEIGEGGRLEPEVIAEGVRCIRNGLIGLGMIVVRSSRISSRVAPPAASSI
jgi:hypothetical protein